MSFSETVCPHKETPVSPLTIDRYGAGGATTTSTPVIGGLEFQSALNASTPCLSMAIFQLAMMSGVIIISVS